MAEEKKKEKLDPLVEKISKMIDNEYVYMDKSTPITDESKQLYVKMHHEIVSGLDDIVERYKGIRLSDEELKNIKGKDGLVDYFKKISKSANNPLKYHEVENSEQLYDTMKQNLAMVLRAGNDKRKPEELIEKFIKTGDLEVFDLIREGMQFSEKNQYLSGYLGKNLDGIGNEKRLELAAAHASYQSNTQFGLTNPSHYEILENLEGNLMSSFQKTHQVYAQDKDSGAGFQRSKKRYKR